MARKPADDILKKMSNPELADAIGRAQALLAMTKVEKRKLTDELISRRMIGSAVEGLLFRVVVVGPTNIWRINVTALRAEFDEAWINARSRIISRSAFCKVYGRNGKEIKEE
jgi:hypothetical protein